MVFSPIKTRLSILIAANIVIFALAGFALAAQPNEEAIQPKGLNHAGIYKLRQFDPNLTGAGVKFALVSRSFTYIDGKPQNDYQPAIDHNCFENANFIFHDLQQMPPGVSPHSTAVCSILFGSDPNASNEQVGKFNYEGAAPQGQADIYEFWTFLIDNVFPFSSPEANVITADIGYQFEDWWTRGIEAMAQQNGSTVIVGIGNGSNASDPPLYPGASANVIGVGVVQSVNTGDPIDGLSQFALVYPEYSSKGPTSDGRTKPDIVAPGNCLAAIAGEQGLYEPTGDWSSFATPIVAGAAGLLIQKASSDEALQAAVSNSVIKALLLNSATKLPYWHKGKLTKEDDHDIPLDFMQGAGMVNAFEAYNQLTAGRHIPGDCPPAGWDVNKLTRNETPANSYRFKIDSPANKIITATVDWNRNFETVYPFEHLKDKDADIRLELWATDSSDPNKDYLLDYSDSRMDNVEHIYTPADPNFTQYELVVLYSQENVSQPETTPAYGLAWNVSQKPEKDVLLWLDLNADGAVNELDIKMLLENILAGIETPDRYLFGDINSDGVLDVKDLNIFINYISPPNPQVNQ